MAIELYGRGRYREALVEFNKAVALSPEDPVLLCNRGVALLQLGEVSRARDDVASCLSKTQDPEEKAPVDAQLQAISTILDSVTPKARRVADAAARAAKKLKDPDKLKDPPNPTPREGWGLFEFGLVAAGTGVTLLASSALLDLASAGLVQEFKMASQGRVPRTRYNDLRAQVETRRTVFYSMLASGAVLTTVGAGFAAFGWWNDQVTLTPTASPEGAGVSLRVSF